MDKKLWVFDCDGVIADTEKSALDWHNQTYGTSHRREDMVRYLFRELWGCDEEEEFKRLDLYYETTHFDNTPPIPGAIEGIRKFYELGHEGMILTARPKSLVAKTHDWFARHAPNKFKEIAFSNAYGSKGDGSKEKPEICLEKKAHGIVEDSHNNAINCFAKGINVIVLNQPWNIGSELPRGIMRARDWNEVVELISKS